MAENPAQDINNAKLGFKSALRDLVSGFVSHVSDDDGNWTVKGFIDIYRNIYTISSDTKIISKILEIHLFPMLLKFAEANDLTIVLPEHQNWYPDISFISKRKPHLKFALDLKTTYRDPDYPGHVNGFTLGSHGAYFRDRSSKKNIQFPYSEYAGHFCLGVIYSRAREDEVDETEVFAVHDMMDSQSVNYPVGNWQVTRVEHLQSIASVISNFQFFVCEKWELASDRRGSGNTANIGSITHIPDIIEGKGIFANLGED